MIRTGGNAPVLDTLLLRFHAEISARRGDGLVVRERIYSGEPLPCAAVGSRDVTPPASQRSRR